MYLLGECLQLEVKLKILLSFKINWMTKMNAGKSIKNIDLTLWLFEKCQFYNRTYFRLKFEMFLLTNKRIFNFPVVDNKTFIL